MLHGRELDDAVSQAGALLATVVGQDLDEGTDGVFSIARRVARDRVISTMDPDARQGHKTFARGFDGYKGHVGIDPDSEIITATVVTTGNAGDGAAASDLITDLITDNRPETQPSEQQASAEQSSDQQPDAEQPATNAGREAADDLTGN
ncbi:MAG: transposase [Pseudonocardiaceae bacterium]|nr:transposase [Pseudonocardiaceae bacterium]